MKNSIVILAFGLFSLVSADGFAQAPGYTIRPSAYGTAGSYSNGINARAFDVYASCSLPGGDYVDAGYEGVGLDHSLWTYDQTLAVAGGGINYYPLYIQAHYGRLQGTFNLKNITYTYNDRGNIFNALAYYNWDMFYLGFSYSYVDVAGYKNIISRQASPRVDWVASPSVVLSASALYSQLSDGRALYAVSGQSTLYPLADVMLRVSATLGERAYYFNPDIVSVYNQDATQRTVLGATCEYTVWKPITLAVSYQYSEFAGYTVRSATLGVRGAINF